LLILQWMIFKCYRLLKHINNKHLFFVVAILEENTNKNETVIFDQI